MVDRDTSGIGGSFGAGTGGPNRKDQNSTGQSGTSQPGSQPNATSQQAGSHHNDMGRMSNTDRNSSANSSMGNNATDRMSGDVSRMADDATQAGRDSINSAQGRIRSLLEQQSHRAADQLGSVANALHKAAEQLNDENNGTAARYAGQAADRVEQVADMLRTSSVDDMVGQVERFARRQPEVFVGAAFAVGFLFARFIKSSGDRRFQGQGGYQSGHQGGYRAPTSRMTSDRMSGYRDDDRSSFSAGRSATASGMGTGMASGAGRDVGRGMAGGIAGSTAAGSSSAYDRNHATAGAAPPRASLNAATAATSAARTRDAAQLMAGGSPEPTRTSGIGSTGTGTGQSNQGRTGADSTPVTGVKPQGTLP